MIVRKYGRRNRGITRPCSDDGEVSGFDGFVDDEMFVDSLPQDCSVEIYSNPFSSQDSLHLWSMWICTSPRKLRMELGESSQEELEDGDMHKSKKAKNGKPGNGDNNKELKIVMFPSTATLMEIQECGEMMEHEDEVYFAVDGLRKGQLVRIRRASMLSLLSSSAMVQQRRRLRKSYSLQSLQGGICFLRKIK